MKKNLIALLILSFILVGCSEVREKVRIDNVKRIFLQSEYDYILYIQESDLKEVSTFKLSVQRNQRIRIFTDVEKGQSSWVEYSKVYFGQNTNSFLIEEVMLHIHSLSEIQGGEYRTSEKHPKTFQNNLVE